MIDPERILDIALDASGGDAEATLLLSDRTVARFARASLRQTTTLAGARTTIRAIVDGRAGVASTASLIESEIVAAARIAREMARFGNPLAPPSGGAPQARRPLATELPHAAPPGLLLADVFQAAAADGAQLYGTVSSTSSTFSTASSAGRRRHAALTRADSQIIAVRGENSGYASRAGTGIDDLDVADLASSAVARASLLAGAESSLEDGSWDVVLDPPAVAEVLEWLAMIAFSGRSFEDESSLVAGRVGERVWGPGVTIVNDPVSPSFLPLAFDAEGTDTRLVPLVDAGIARSVMFDRGAAARAGIEPNGGCPDLNSEDHGIPLHLHLLEGSATRRELLDSEGPTVHVTRFNYVNGLLEPKIALMTGLTRDGTFLYEGGRPVRRLRNARWTQSITEAFAAVDAISRDTETIAGWWNPFGGYRVPAMRIRGWRFRSG